MPYISRIRHLVSGSTRGGDLFLDFGELIVLAISGARASAEPEPAQPLASAQELPSLKKRMGKMSGTYINPLHVSFPTDRHDKVSGFTSS